MTYQIQAEPADFFKWLLAARKYASNGAFGASIIEDIMEKKTSGNALQNLVLAFAKKKTSVFFQIACKIIDLKSFEYPSSFNQKKTPPKKSPFFLSQEKANGDTSHA